MNGEQQPEPGYEKKSGQSPEQGEHLSARTIALMLWTLLPIPAIWVGLYVIKSATWAFALYHIICLIPAIIWGQKIWRPSFLKPSRKEMAALLGASVVFSGLALLLYEVLGKKLLSNEETLTLLKTLGYSKELFYPLSFYAIVVNPLVEELFWRGVVFNELEKVKAPFKHFGLIWSSLAYAAFHYLIFRMVLFPIYAEIGTLMLAVYGAVLALIYRKTGSILTTAIAHGLLTDMAAIVLILDLLYHYPGRI